MHAFNSLLPSEIKGDSDKMQFWCEIECPNFDDELIRMLEVTEKEVNKAKNIYVHKLQ